MSSNHEKNYWNVGENNLIEDVTEYKTKESDRIPIARAFDESHGYGICISHNKQMDLASRRYAKLQKDFEEEKSKAAEYARVARETIDANAKQLEEVRKSCLNGRLSLENEVDKLKSIIEGLENVIVKIALGNK